MGILGMGPGKDAADLLMGLFDGYLLCTDCDGTLTDRESRLSEENIAAIRHFQEEGGLFTLATGRYPKYVNRFEGQFYPNTYLIMGNGSTLLAPVIPEKDREKVKGIVSPSYEEPVLIEETVFPELPREEILFMIKSRECGLMFTDLRNRSESWMSEEGDAFWNNVFQETEHDLDRWMARIDERYLERKLCPDDTDKADLPHKVIFVFETEEQTIKAKAHARTQFPERTFERSWPCGLELLPPGSGKGGAVRRLREILAREGRPAKKVICAGDYENDASMLREADIGYATSNATKECLAAADRVTVSCDENAIAAIIKELEEGLA